MTGVAVARESTGSSGSAMPASAGVRSPGGAVGAAGTTSTNADAGRAEPAPPTIPGTTATSSAPLTKRYFRIGEVARIVGVEAHVLRYWEREFRQIRPEKSQRGHRGPTSENFSRFASSSTRKALRLLARRSAYRCRAKSRCPRRRARPMRPPRRRKRTSTQAKARRCDRPPLKWPRRLSPRRRRRSSPRPMMRSSPSGMPRSLRARSKRRREFRKGRDGNFSRCVPSFLRC